MTGAVWGINVIIQPSTSITSRITIDKPGLGGPDKMVVMVMMAKMLMMIMVMVMMALIVLQHDSGGLGNNVISQGVWQGVGTLREGKDHFTPLFRALSGMGFEIARGEVSLHSTGERCVI